ncbi:TetR/AcrR family transcriptional regulator [Glycomyces niveus]|uniref:TetR/AcrR family transcriptional regulator n=1 Tax=Glycomyces niveus TaxID=2820287 RepID=A0ABS3TZB1_9ACTN|nr:TetR/AcrR family transcriptional regulator [Glycomyces sp. NEAU-S30]MBO3731844.1 TetR/AcrR family transcriptional regulator [Glycomyces sp. NEAU-S30]
MKERVLSTAEERRGAVVSSAIASFARGGFHTVTIAEVAKHAGISPAYVSKLFSSKTQLFVAALEECYRRIVDALERGAEASEDGSPDAVLDAMGAAYATLIADRDLLAIQVHAQSATADPVIARTVRQGIAALTEYVAARSRADGPAVQRFMAYGQLCHLLTAIDAFDSDAEWAETLTEGIRHMPARRPS